MLQITNIKGAISKYLIQILRIVMGYCVKSRGGYDTAMFI